LLWGEMINLRLPVHPAAAKTVHENHWRRPAASNNMVDQSHRSFSTASWPPSAAKAPARRRILLCFWFRHARDARPVPEATYGAVQVGMLAPYLPEKTRNLDHCARVDN
jgi:hypothetical protein